MCGGFGDGQDKVDETVKALEGRHGVGITADLTDRMQVERVRQRLADEHADATLLVNAAGLFLPKPSSTTRAPTTTRTSNWTGPSSSSPRRWPAAWSRGAAAGPS